MRKKSSHSSGPSVHNVIGGGETATSTDGKTWTTHDYNDLHLPYPYDLHAITWSKDLKLFVAVGGAGSYDFIGTSSNVLNSGRVCDSQVACFSPTKNMR